MVLLKRSTDVETSQVQLIKLMQMLESVKAHLQDVVQSVFVEILDCLIEKIPTGSGDSLKVVRKRSRAAEQPFAVAMTVPSLETALPFAQYTTLSDVVTRSGARFGILTDGLVWRLIYFGDDCESWHRHFDAVLSSTMSTSDAAIFIHVFGAKMLEFPPLGSSKVHRESIASFWIPSVQAGCAALQDVLQRYYNTNDSITHCARAVTMVLLHHLLKDATVSPGVTASLVPLVATIQQYFVPVTCSHKASPRTLDCPLAIHRLIHGLTVSCERFEVCEDASLACLRLLLRDLSELPGDNAMVLRLCHEIGKWVLLCTTYPDPSLTPPSRRLRVNFASDICPNDLSSAYESLIAIVSEETTAMTVSSSRKQSEDRLARQAYYSPSWPVDVVVRGTVRPLLVSAVPTRNRPQVERSAAAALSKPLDALSAIRILDPACGCGNLLLRTQRYIVQFLTDAYREQIRSQGCCYEWDSTISVVDVVSTVTANMLYGVDRDPTAVFITKTELLLLACRHANGHMTASQFDALFGAVSRHVACGDSLTGCSRLSDIKSHPNLHNIAESLSVLLQTATCELPTTTACIVRWMGIVADLRVSPNFIGNCSVPPAAQAVLWTAVAHCKAVASLPVDPSAPPPQSCRDCDRLRGVLDSILDGASYGPLTKSLHWFLSFWTEMNSGGFHAVVSNPPWGIVEHAVSLSAGMSPLDAEKKRECDVYCTVLRSCMYPNCGQGKRQLYNSFVERSLSLLAPGGRFGCIVQNGFLSGVNSRSIRQLLAETTRLDFVFEFAAKNVVFPDVHKGVALLVCSKREHGGGIPSSQTTSFRKLFVPSVGQGFPSARNTAAFATNLELYTLAQRGGLLVHPCFWLMNDGDYCVPTQLSGVPSLDVVATGTAGDTLSTWLSCRQGDFNSSTRRGETCSVFMTGSRPFVEGKHVRAFTIISCEWLLGKEHDKFTTTRITDVGATREYRIVMQEVVDLNKHRKCVAALLAPGVVCAHSTTVHSVNLEQFASHPVLQRLEPSSDLTAVPPQVLFALALLGSKLLEWILRTRDRSDHVSKTALQRLPFPSLREVDTDLSTSLGGNVTENCGDGLIEIDAIWEALQSMSVPQRCQHVVNLCALVLLGETCHSNELDAAVCALYGVSYDGYLFVMKQFQPLQLPVAVSSEFSDRAGCEAHSSWPSDADLEVWCQHQEGK